MTLGDDGLILMGRPGPRYRNPKRLGSVTQNLHDRLMQPIRELLNQIRWDPNFRGEFEIAFVDHAKPELERVSVRDLRFDPDNSFSFQLLDPEGHWVSIPLHRIREVYRDRELIWSRPDP